MLTSAQLDRLQAALDAGAATPTAALTALLLEVGGEHCYQRPRLVHRLTLLLHSQRPPQMATSTTHRFKSAFAGKDFSGFVLNHDGKTKLVTAANLADEDVAPMQRNGGAHLLEPIPAGEQSTASDAADSATGAAPASPAKVKGISHKKLAGKIDYEKLASHVADELERRYGRPTVQAAATTASPDGVETVNSGILKTATEQHEDGTTVIKHSEGGPDDLPITAPAADQDAASTPDKVDVEEQPAAQADAKPAKKKH